MAPTRAARGVAALAPDPLWCCAAVRPRVRPSASALRAVGRPFCALRVLPRRGPCPVARPLRRAAPGPRASCAAPPRPAARPLVRRSAAPRALACPAGSCLPVRSGAGLLRRPSCASGRLRPRRGCGGCSACPLRASPARPSAPAPFARPFGPRSFPLRGPGLLLRARARAGLLSLRGVLPCAPPPRRPRWGLRGARCPLGGFAPASGARFSRPSAAPPPRCARLRWPRSGLG